MSSESRRHAPVLDEYLVDFGLTKRDLIGKIILDAGAGLRQFAADCAGDGVGEVWSIVLHSDDWLTTRQRMEQAEKLKSDSPWLTIWREVERRSQCGQFMNLPYAKESFDLVLSHNAVTQAFDNEREMEVAMLEVTRVLKPGGEARFFPGWTDNWPVGQKYVVWGALGKIVDIPGIKIEVKSVEIKIGGLRISGSIVILYKD